MQSSYALTAKTLEALGLADDGGNPSWDDVRGILRTRRTPAGAYTGALYVLTPVDAYRVLRRLVELLTGVPLGNEAQVAVVRFRADGEWCVSGHDGSVLLWPVHMPRLHGTEHARDWLHAVGLTAVAVADEHGSGAHHLYVNTGDGWEVCDG